MNLVRIIGLDSYYKSNTKGVLTLYYPDQRYYITFFTKRYKDFEKSINANASKPKGSPKVPPDIGLIFFFAIMMIKGINRFIVKSKIYARFRYVGLNRPALP